MDQEERGRLLLLHPEFVEPPQVAHDDVLSPVRAEDGAEAAAVEGAVGEQAEQLHLHLGGTCKKVRYISKLGAATTGGGEEEEQQQQQ